MKWFVIGLFVAIAVLDVLLVLGCAKLEKMRGVTMTDDLIKRGNAIWALRCEYPTMPMVKSLREEWAVKTEGYRKAEEVIMRLPSADRPQGEWIPSDTGGFVCSVCKSGYRNQPTLMGKPMFEYCPCCGAKMKGADDE